MTEPLMASSGESFPSVERFDIYFKRRIAHATSEEEKAIRQEWAATRLKLYGEPPPQPGPAPVPDTFENHKGLQKFFKRRIARAQSKDEAATIRQEWDAAEGRFWANLDLRKKAEPVTETAVDPEAEAIAAARRQYGSPIGSSGGMRHIYADPPQPIQVHWPTVEIITEEEGK